MNQRLGCSEILTAQVNSWINEERDRFGRAWTKTNNVFLPPGTYLAAGNLCVVCGFFAFRIQNRETDLGKTMSWSTHCLTRLREIRHDLCWMLGRNLISSLRISSLTTPHAVPTARRVLCPSLIWPNPLAARHSSIKHDPWLYIAALFSKRFTAFCNRRDNLSYGFRHWQSNMPKMSPPTRIIHPAKD